VGGFYVDAPRPLALVDPRLGHADHDRHQDPLGAVPIENPDSRQGRGCPSRASGPCMELEQDEPCWTSHGNGYLTQRHGLGAVDDLVSTTEPDAARQRVVGSAREDPELAPPALELAPVLQSQDPRVDGEVEALSRGEPGQVVELEIQLVVF